MSPACATCIDGAVSDAGFHARALGTYQVTAEAKDNYVLQGDSSWSRTVSKDVCPVTPVAPTKENESCTGTDDGGITIPDVTGVRYLIDGTLAAAGFHPLVLGDYQVTAEAKDNYVLEGYPDGGWPRTVAKQKCVEFVGRTVGTQAATSIALPADWQPGDLAVMLVMKNATATQPTIPTGWTRPAQTTAGSTTSQVTSSLFVKTLAAGDVNPSWGSVTFRAVLGDGLPQCLARGGPRAGRHVDDPHVPGTGAAAS